MTSGAFSFLLPPGVPVQATAPPNPQVGEMYFDTEWNELRTWDGAEWIGTQDVAVQSTPPTDGSVLWVDPSGATATSQGPRIIVSRSEPSRNLPLNTIWIRY